MVTSRPLGQIRVENIRAATGRALAASGRTCGLVMDLRGGCGMVEPGYYVLIYDLVDDYVERRQVFREEHLGLAREAHARGELVMAGALAEPADSALLVFRANDAAVVEGFARNDPYVVNGLVRAWRVRPWNVVIGRAASGDDSTTAS